MIEFEGLHVICFACGKVGHRSGSCVRKTINKDSQATHETIPESTNLMQDVQPLQKVTEESEKIGPWIMVSRKHNPPISKGMDMCQKPKDKDARSNTNKFVTLQTNNPDEEKMGTKSGTGEDEARFCVRYNEKKP